MRPAAAVLGTETGLLTAGVPMVEIMSSCPLRGDVVLSQCIGRPPVTVHRILRKSAAFAAASLAHFPQAAQSA